MKAITTKQQAVLDYIRAYHREHGLAPTVREIARHVGVSSSCTVQRCLDALERKGAIKRGGYQYRGITLLQDPPPKFPEMEAALREIHATTGISTIRAICERVLPDLAPRSRP